MSERSTPTLSIPTAEQRRIAADNYDRARQVIATQNYDYGIDLLMTCCQLDPSNIVFRNTLRKTQKEKYGNDMKGSRVAMVTTLRHKQRMKTAKMSRDYLRVIEQGEHVLAKNPWDMGTQMDMAEAFDALGLLDLAVLTLDQARQKYPKDATLNRALARLFEKRGDFTRAMSLWQLVREASPTDVEAAHKAKDLAASDTIARGQYEETASGSKPSMVIEKMEAKGLSDHKIDRAEREAAPLLQRIQADPTEATLYTQLAGIFRKYGREDRARAVLQQGLGPTGGHFSLKLELTELDLVPLRKNYEEAQARVKAAKTKPGTHDDGPTLEELRILRNNLEKEVNTREIDLYRMKADRFPQDLTNRFELGIRLMKADLLDEAIAELQQARKDEKLKGRASLALGHGFRKRNNWRLAQRNFEEALASLPESDEAARKDVLFYLASGAAENGDIPRALDLGHELANLDFSYKNIGALLDDWQTKVG